MTTKNALVTGGAGFVGSNLVAALLSRSPRPNVVARPATVGPCQTRAWLSMAIPPMARTTLPVM